MMCSFVDYYLMGSFVNCCLMVVVVVVVAVVAERLLGVVEQIHRFHCG
jgi:hypothetical protein